jgi:flagellar motor protein MotB
MGEIWETNEQQQRDFPVPSEKQPPSQQHQQQQQRKRQLQDLQQQLEQQQQQQQQQDQQHHQHQHQQDQQQHHQQEKQQQQQQQEQHDDETSAETEQTNEPHEKWESHDLFQPYELHDRKDPLGQTWPNSYESCLSESHSTDDTDGDALHFFNHEDDHDHSDTYDDNHNGTNPTFDFTRRGINDSFKTSLDVTSLLMEISIDIVEFNSDFLNKLVGTDSDPSPDFSSSVSNAGTAGGSAAGAATSTAAASLAHADSIGSYSLSTSDGSPLKAFSNRSLPMRPDSDGSSSGISGGGSGGGGCGADGADARAGGDVGKNINSASNGVGNDRCRSNSSGPGNSSKSYDSTNAFFTSNSGSTSTTKGPTQTITNTPCTCLVS